MSAALAGSVPGLAAFHRGLAAQKAEDVETAIAAYREAIDRSPDLAAAHFNLGQLLLRDRSEVAEAARCFERATRLRPTAPDAWINLGVCRERLGDLPTAMVCYREVLRLDPGSATARFNLGNVLKKEGDLLAALAEYRAAGRLIGESAQIELNLGTTLAELGRWDEATAALERAARLQPDWPEPRVNLALSQLARGDLINGWKNYEWRWAQIGLAPDRGYAWPLWRGEPLRDKSILVWREQGLGDELLFVTCVPDLVRAGARVTLTADRRLVTLLSRALPGVTVQADDDPRAETFDFHAPIGSLPRFVRSNRAAFKPAWSMLVPDRAQLSRWRDRLAALPAGLRVGICWRSGLVTSERRRFYSRLDQWRPLFEIPGVSWINLQYDQCEAELAQAEADFGIRIHRWPAIDLKNDLEAVAALVWNLDVVVTAPTAVSSLAGLLGVETWELDTGSDWTALGEARSPWLPSVRLARASVQPGAWEPVLRAVATEIAAKAGNVDNAAFCA